MSARHGDIDRQTVMAAAEWFALLQSSEASDDDRTRWQQWRDGSAEARRAWALVERVSGHFAQLPDGVLAPALQAASGSRRRVAKMLLSAAGFGMAGWLGSRLLPLDAWRADHRTHVGEIRAQRLADGSRLWIDTDSAVDIRGNPAADIEIVLHAGRLLIDTAERTIPMRMQVAVAGARLQPQGTRFAVRCLDDGQALLAVFAGEVRAMPRQGTPVLVPAGTQAVFEHRRVHPQAPADPRHDVWPQGLLVADGMSVREFASELARYRRGHLRVDEAVAGLRLTGRYSLADTDRALAALAETLPLRVHVRFPGWTDILPAS